MISFSDTLCFFSIEVVYLEHKNDKMHTVIVAAKINVNDMINSNILFSYSYLVERLLQIM